VSAFNGVDDTMGSMPAPSICAMGCRLLQRVGIALPCLVAAAASAQIYVGGSGDASGSVVLSNHPSEATPTLLLSPETLAIDLRRPEPQEMLAVPAPRSTVVRQASPSVSALIGAVARDHALAEPLIKAVIAVESGFEPNARSPKGAMGLMQLMPETARRFGARNPFAVEENLRAGAAYLRWLLDLFEGDVQLALAAYNAGEQAVMRAGWRIPNFAETRAYVPKVLSYLAHYESRAVGDTRSSGGVSLER
jgi:soluble lytic murein transglycosylase-like protein